MNSYHFSLGNSSDGPIGFCARITAETEAQAVDILQTALSESTDEDWALPIPGDAHCVGGVEYIRVYFNRNKITPTDIDEVERDS